MCEKAYVEFREEQDSAILAERQVNVAPTVIAFRCESQYARLEDVRELNEYQQMINFLVNDK